MSDDVEIPIYGAMRATQREVVRAQHAVITPPPPRPTREPTPTAPGRTPPPVAPGGGGRGPQGPAGPGGPGDPGGDQPSRRPRLRKLRLLAILVGLGVLAVISTLFGMLMSVASDIPQIENVTQYSAGHNSYLYDDHGRPIGIFAAPDPEVIDGWDQISQSMVHAIVAVEDKRFWSAPGIDLRGIARAFVSDVSGGATQGASTIAEQ